MADGLRGRDNYKLSILTATTPTKVYTALEQIRDGLSFGFTRDTWDNDDFDEKVFKKEGVGNMTVSISGEYKVKETAPAQAALEDAFYGTGTIEVQWADRIGAGKPLYTAIMNITDLTSNISDPLTKSFSLSLNSTVTKTTQA